VLEAAREVQIPLLAVLLVGGCVAKAAQARHEKGAAGPGVLFPLRLRQPVAVALVAGEFALGLGLLVTAGRAGAGGPALAVRIATGLLFCTAVGALYVLRTRRPEAGCGCFGELSRTPAGGRAITRAALLCAAALSSIGLAPLRMPGSAGQAGLMLGLAGAELALLALLSPEFGQVMARLSHADPCEVRKVSVSRTLSALRASPAWRRYQPYLSAAAPVDLWREGCWRFVVYPGVLAGRNVEVVFAVSLAGRRAPVRVGLLDADEQEAVCSLLASATDV
jgi:hypothetical protein